MNNNEVYFCIDGEFSGPIPPTNYMMSFASVAFTLEDGFIGEFSINLKPLPNAVMDPDTKKNFWDKNPEAYAATLINQIDPEDGMLLYEKHVNHLLKPKSKPVIIEYPGCSDFMYLYWYMHTFLGRCMFGHSSLALRSYYSGMAKVPYRNASKSKMPKHWFNKEFEHTHVALDDARGQAYTAMSMMYDNYRSDKPINTSL